MILFVREFFIYPCSYIFEMSYLDIKLKLNVTK
jgi:hypothetical protein